jgi:hypothetical protein
MKNKIEKTPKETLLFPWRLHIGPFRKLLLIKVLRNVNG